MINKVKESSVFKRDKTPLDVKILAAMLCKLIGRLLNSSLSIWLRAFIALKGKLERRCAAIDETKIKLGKEQLMGCERY